MKIQNFAGISQGQNNKQAPSFGTYSVYRNSSCGVPLKTLAEKVPAAFVHFDKDKLVVVPLHDMTFYARLKTAAEKSAFLKYLFSPDNAPLITAKDIKERDMASLLAEVTMNEEKFKGFLATLIKTGDK